MRGRRGWKRLVRDALAWALVALLGWVALSIAFGLTWPPPTPILQAGALYLLLAAYPLAVVAALHRRWLRVAVASGLVLAHLVLVVPLAVVRHHPDSVANLPTVHVFFANARYDNHRLADAAAAIDGSGADVIAVAELSKGLLEALRARGVLDRYPYQVLRPINFSSGIGLLSRLPLTDGRLVDLGFRPVIAATLTLGGHPLDLFVVHPQAPAGVGTDRWRGELAAIRQATTALADHPTLVVGDFNATYTHPPLRSFFAAGFTDCHQWLGQGLSRSWPTDRWFPPLVRLDHALVRTGAHPLDVRDVTVPGSDHRGFVVGVAVG